MSNPNHYRRAGVNIDAGDALIARIKPKLAASGARLSAHGSGQLAAAGGFAAAVRMPPTTSPVLVACTDGIGTKAALLAEHDLPQTAGVDVVAMCVNDLLCVGAQPLFFLDYYACDSLSPDFAARVIDGIICGCEQAGCALIGGETAEMPGMYAHNAFDLAGFAVGVADESALLDSQTIMPGDALIAIASSGPHSNGYSLIRRLWQDVAPPPEIVAALLLPTRIYCRSVAQLRERVTVRGLAHITGGGLVDNVPRILPSGVAAQISPPPLSPVFEWICRSGQIADDEMRRVFNCGIGMVVVVAAADVDLAMQSLADSGETCSHIGRIIESEQRRVVFL